MYQSKRTDYRTTIQFCGTNYKNLRIKSKSGSSKTGLISASNVFFLLLGLVWPHRMEMIKSTNDSDCADKQIQLHDNFLITDIWAKTTVPFNSILLIYNNLLTKHRSQQVVNRLDHFNILSNYHFVSIYLKSVGDAQMCWIKNVWEFHIYFVKFAVKMEQHIFLHRKNNENLSVYDFWST